MLAAAVVLSGVVHPLTRCIAWRCGPFNDHGGGSFARGMGPDKVWQALQLWRAGGCARGAYFAKYGVIYMNFDCLITVVNKIIVFLK